MGSVVTFLAYLEFPNSILIKNQTVGQIILIFPDFPDIPPLAKCAAPFLGSADRRCGVALKFDRFLLLKTPDQLPIAANK